VLVSIVSVPPALTADPPLAAAPAAKIMSSPTPTVMVESHSFLNDMLLSLG
jgi:hypothetical protein